MNKNIKDKIMPKTDAEINKRRRSFIEFLNLLYFG